MAPEPLLKHTFPLTPTRIRGRGPLLLLLLVVASAHSAPAALTTPSTEPTHPAVYGDVTYDEWVHGRGLPRLSDTKSIEAQLLADLSKDQWAGYILAELLQERSGPVFRTDVEQALRSSAALGNSLSASLLGEYLFVHGKTGDQKALINEAAKSGNPRALTLSTMWMPPESEEAISLLTLASSGGDELAEFYLGVRERMRTGAFTDSAQTHFKKATQMSGYLSADPLVRSARLANDAPDAFYYLAVAMYTRHSTIASNEDLKEIERLLMTAATRTTPRDVRATLRTGEDVSVRAHMVLAELYYSGPLQNRAKVVSELEFAAKHNEPTAYSWLASMVYRPVRGIAPNRERYIEMREMAADKGGVPEKLQLADEYISGSVFPQDVDKAINLIGKLDDQSSADVSTAMGKALLYGNEAQSAAGLKLLSELWRTTPDTSIARSLSGFYDRQRADPTAIASAELWRQQGLAVALAASDESEVTTIAMEGVVQALNRTDREKYVSWRAVASAHDEERTYTEIIAVTDASWVIANPDDAEFQSTLATLKVVAEKGSAPANSMLGGLALSLSPEQRRSNGLSPYEVYFDRAIAISGKDVTRTIIALLLRQLGPADQPALLNYLEKTKAFHGVEEAGLYASLRYLEARKRGQPSPDPQFVLEAMRKGSGYAAGFIAVRHDAGDSNIRTVRTDIQLLMQSLSSDLPMPDAYGALGARYLNGRDVRQDLETAEFLLRQGAEAGSAKALLAIARGLADGRLGGAKDLRGAIEFARLAEAYGDAEGRLLEQEYLIALDRETATEQQASQVVQAPPSPALRSSGGGGGWKKLGAFLGTLLEVGLVVGMVVLAGGAAYAQGGDYSPPAIQQTQAAYGTIYGRSPSAPPASVTPAQRVDSRLRSAGVPSYIAPGVVSYSTTVAATAYGASPISVGGVSRGSSGASSPSIPSTVEFREKLNYDPSSRYRGNTGPDGSFVAKNIGGSALQGRIAPNTAGSLELEVRPRMDWDPEHRFKGELQPGGVVILKNHLTGQSVRGTYDWSNSYIVR